MKLNYGSFEAIFTKYFSYSSELDYLYDALAEYSDVDKTTIVLLASVRGNESEIEDALSINSTTLSKFRTSERDINKKLKDMAKRCEESYTEDFFEYNLLEYVPGHLYPALIQDYLKLIDYDHTISPKNKAQFHSLVHEGLQKQSVARFLSSVFRYALIQDNTWHENTIIHAPHGRNPFFTGRKEELHRMRDALHKSDMVTLSGMPGCGKSELALAYVNALPDAQWTILFVDAETAEGIINSYRELINFLSLKEDIREMQEDTVISEVKRWADSEKCLFIFDNVDYADRKKRHSLQKYLPAPKNSTKIIFTTRNKKPYLEETVISLSGFSEEESVEYIMHRANRTKNKKGAAAIAKRLAYYPLVLSQAASFLNIYQGISFENYLDRLKDGLEILEKYAEYSDAERSLRETMQITFSTLSPSERDLLQLASYFSEDGMHLHILNRLFYQMYVYRGKEASSYLAKLEKDTELRCTMAARLFPFGYIGYYYADCTDEMAQKIDISLYSHYSLGKSKRKDLPSFLQSEEIRSLAEEDHFLKASQDITQKSLADFILSARNYDDLAYFNNNSFMKMHRLVMEALREMDNDLHYLKLAIDIMYDVTPNVRHGVISVYEDNDILEVQARALCRHAFDHFAELSDTYKDKVADIARYVMYWMDFEEEIDLGGFGDPEFDCVASSDEECDTEHMKALRDMKMDSSIPTTRWY